MIVRVDVSESDCFAMLEDLVVEVEANEIDCSYDDEFGTVKESDFEIDGIQSVLDRDGKDISQMTLIDFLKNQIDHDTIYEAYENQKGE